MLERPAMYDQVDLPEIYAKDIRLINASGYHLIGLINETINLLRTGVISTAIAQRPIMWAT